MSAVSRMAGKWGKKKLGDLVEMKDAKAWPGLPRGVVASHAGVIVRADGVKFDVRLHVDPRADADAEVAPQARHASGRVAMSGLVSAPATGHKQVAAVVYMKNSTVVTVPEGDVDLYFPETQAFPLGELPLSALSCVMAQFHHLRDAASVSLVSKKFLQAFRDESAWRARCWRELPHAISERGERSWLALYRDYGMWRIRVLTLDHRLTAVVCLILFCLNSSPIAAKAFP
jgi:hypothetical protein